MNLHIGLLTLHGYYLSAADRERLRVATEAELTNLLAGNAEGPDGPVPTDTIDILAGQVARGVHDELRSWS